MSKYLNLSCILSRSEIKLQAANALEIVLEQDPTIEDFFLLRSIIQQFIQLLYDPQHSKLSIIIYIIQKAFSY